MVAHITHINQAFHPRNQELNSDLLSPWLVFQHNGIGDDDQDSHLPDTKPSFFALPRCSVFDESMLSSVHTISVHIDITVCLHKQSHDYGNADCDRTLVLTTNPREKEYQPFLGPMDTYGHYQCLSSHDIHNPHMLGLPEGSISY